MSLYSAYLPRDRRNALLHNLDLPDRVTGAALLADLSGFTRLTATLADELGPRSGAEALVGHLDHVFTILISIVHDYQGDVILFNGDAITCWFPENKSTAEGRGAAEWAISCALEMQAAMREIDSISTPGGTTIPMAIKVGIASGTARRFLLGDPDAYVMEALAGQTLDRMAAAEELAFRGEIVASAEVVDSSPEEVQVGEWRLHGGQRYATITGLPSRLHALPTDTPLAVTDQLAQCWLLPPVSKRIGEGTEMFLADLRPTVSMFMGFSGIDYDHDEAAGDKLNQFVIAAQTILDRYEGYLVQVAMGDKGSLLYMAFGAPVAHENDSKRAAAAALSLNRLDEEFDFLESLQIGISRGVVYSGAYGSPDRRTYSLLGSEVNVAARLMTAAESGTILVSDHIAQDIKFAFTLEPVPPVTGKGIEQPLKVWRLAGKQSLRDEPIGRSHQPEMIGRVAERELISERVSALCAGVSTILLVEGSAGVGKSLLIADLLNQAREQDQSEIVVLVGAGDAIEQTTPYLPWQPILQQIADRATALTVAEDRQARTDAFLQWLDPDVRDLAPLLNPLMALRLPENQLIQQMSGEGRLLNTQELILSMLRKVSDGLPLLLIIDDAQWLDSLSMGLVRRMSRELEPVLLVLAMRPQFDAIATELEALRGRSATLELKLDTLPIEDIERVIAGQMEADAVDGDVLDFINAKTEGQPYFTVELANALRDAELIASQNGVVKFVPGSDRAAVDFSDTIQEVITSRIDRLEPQEQVTVKVASVIGRLFAYKILRDVYPTTQDGDRIRTSLDHLEQLELTILESVDPELTYLFKHILTQEVIYGSMTTSQRQELHKNIALWYEDRLENAGNRTIPLLAYHWSRANDPLKAAAYYGKAGENALREYANEEAIQFLNEASRLGRDLAPEQRATWQRLLGEAEYRRTRTSESKAHYEQALSLLGHPVPKSNPGVVAGLLGALVRQFMNRQFSLGPAVEDEEELARLREVAMSLDRISEVYYNTGEELSSFYAVVVALNLAEKSGLRPETVRGYANLSTTMGYLTLTRFADAYRERAVALARDLNHLPTTAWAQIALSSYSLWYGQWDRCLAELAEAMELNAQLGDWRLWSISAWMQAQVTTCLGNLALAGRQWENLYATAVKYEDTRNQIWSRGGQFFNFVYTGKIEEAGACVREFEEIIEQRKEHLIIDERLWHAMHARYALETGQLAGAKEWADGQVAAMQRSKFKYDLLEVFASPVEIRIRLWSKGLATSAEIKEASQILKSYARKYPFARARSLRCEGASKWLSGNKRAAQSLWQKSIAQADKLSMPLEKALTLELIGQFTADEAALAQAQLIRAELAALDNQPVGD
ncbi:MAG: AAA family ATPase [Candidatus Promineifilaceae bacterium]